MPSQAVVRNLSDIIASDPGQEPTLSSDAARELILGDLAAEVARHDAADAAAGERYASRISQFRWSSEARRVLCTLPDGDGANGDGTNGDGAAPAEIRVEVDLPFAVGDPLRLSCSCLRHGEGRARCAHTWAALTRFLDVVHQATDPLLADVFRLESVPAWAHTLSALDDFLGRQASVAEPVPESRLIWRVKNTPLGVELAAWEQKISSQTGEWTRGRQVSWERLREASELWACEADRRAAAAVREYVESYSSGHEPLWSWQADLFTVLAALDGHPLVFHGEAPETRVRVEKTELSLAVTVTDEGLMLDVSLGDEPLRAFSRERLHEDQDERGLVGWVDATAASPARILVAPAHPSVIRFARTLDGKPRVVPPHGREELLRRLNRLESLLPIRLPPELVGDAVPADRRLYLRLAPLNPSGIAAQIRMRPAPDGTYCIPGEGHFRLTGVDRGRRVFVERDLDGERGLARDLAEVLGVAEVPEERLCQWRILEDDTALDLVHAAQYCDETGLAVVEWPAGGQRRVASPISAASLKIEVEDRRDWFSLQGDLSVDGWRLSLLDLLIAMRKGRRYVRLGSSDTWAEIAEGFRERLERLDEVVHWKGGRAEVDATGAPVLRELTAEDGALKASRRFARLLRRLAEAEDLRPEAPEGLRATLRAYQLEGYRWMRRLAWWGVGGCLADDMGLGKTVQALALLLARRGEGPALVVAPTSLGFNWRREAERFTPALTCILFRGADRAAVVRKLGKGDVVVVSYGLLVREIERLASVPWATLVLDEAQAIKNSRSKTAQAVRKVEARWRLALTGTPIENHLGELWSLFHVISPGLFGSWPRFRDRYASPIQREDDADRRRSLSLLVRPFILRRTKSEVLHELPERIEVELRAELSTKERELYEDVRLTTLVSLAQLETDAAQQRFQVLAALTRLRQLACHPALVEEGWEGSSAKLDLLLGIVEELREEDHRALVFSQFTGHLKLIRAALEERGFHCQYLDGQTPVKERAARVDAFQAGEGDVFLISLMAGGTGLNLTAADYVIHMDPWWNPAVEDQATDRAHRMGQKRSVTVYRLVTEGTIEEEILRLHADKRDLVAGVLQGTDEAGRLSTSELIGLIRSGGEDLPEASGTPVPQPEAHGWQG